MRQKLPGIDEVLREALKYGMGGIHPDAEQLKALIERNPEGPLEFVNLLSFYPEARYPEGHEFAGRKMTGAEAYNGHYGPVAFRHVTQRGGRMTVLGTVEQAIIGRDSHWHQVATMEYPNVAAFLDMAADPDYQAGTVHRTAGLADTLVLVTRSLLPPGRALG
jgi:uncharacterized protein (DUF1330 family)